MLLLEEAPVVERYPGRIERTRAASASYRQHLREVQQGIRAQLDAAHIPVTGAVQHLLNAVFVRATPAQAAGLRNLAGVTAVIPLRRYRVSDQLSLSNVPQAWNNSRSGDRATPARVLRSGSSTRESIRPTPPCKIRP